MSGKKPKRKAPGSDDFDTQHVTFNVPNVKRVHFTSTSSSENYSSSSVLGTLPMQQLQHTGLQSTAAVSSPSSGQISIDSALQTKYRKTQNSELLDEFEELFDEFGDLLLEFEADSAVGAVCTCLKSTVTTQCHDCTGYSATCSSCFINKHIQAPFHWAEVWDFAKGFFVRHDISTLGHVIQLGHNGNPCPQPSNPRLFTIVDGNGIHATKIAYCGCKKQPIESIDKVRQLMRSRLFPATSKDPGTAFTFNVLKEFSLHNLESKKAAYDYLGALLRLTDNGFTADVPNPYANFLRVIRVWNYLTLKKRTGQMHGIDSILPHRPAGNKLVWCPACPEPGFNSDPNCPKTPEHLRHCNQSQRTLDGNFQCNQFNKNTDPDDVSLCAGTGYFPPDDEYKEYLANVPASGEKSTCNYLKVVNKQNKKKFKNMAITGTVNYLQYGERFANADAALARALRQRRAGKDAEFTLRIEVQDIDGVTTYDIACEYIVFLQSRFEEFFPDVLEDVKKMRWGVPALHVQGHQDSCNYLFGTAYMECVGHFHGETAEHYWPEANQLGPHVRQMNNGHRQDTMIIHHGDWNHKKTMKMAVTLANDLALAKARYIEKRDHFIGLSISFKDRLDRWKEMDRTPSKIGKEAKSVYKHTTSKVPSQTAIYQAMLAQDNSFESTLIPRNKIARYLNDALKIQDSQRQLHVAIYENTEHNLESTQKEVLSRRTKLIETINTWRQQQKSLTPQLGDKVAAQAAKSPPVPVEDEKLFLPSDLTGSERLELGLVDLGVEETRWREGQAFDALRAVQNIVKAVTALYDRKKKNDRQQKDNSRAGDQIRDTVKRRDRHMQTYECARRAMISLDALQDGPGTSFPPLTEADTFMKSVRQTRRVGDSKFTDGLLWKVTAGVSTTPSSGLTIPVAGTSTSATSGISGTQMETRKSEPRGRSIKPLPSQKQESLESERPEGWLWQLGKMGKLTQREMEEWSSEGDRVQWFRAEAEMQRWQEQKEQKLVELLRTIRSFLKMQWVWLQLSEQHAANKPGHAAYARQKAAMYERRAEEARQLVIIGGYENLLSAAANVLEFIEGERLKEAEYMAHLTS